MNKGTLSSVFILSLCILSFRAAWGAPEAQTLRLIESEPSVQSWMAPEEILQLSLKNHENSQRCPGFLDVTDYPKPAEILSSVQLLKSLGQVPGGPGSEPSHHATVEKLISEVEFERMRSTVSDLSSFHNRYYQSDTGVQASEWIKNRFTEYAGARTDISVEFFSHPRFRQPSVIARMRGEGPHADEVVVIGGHLDSITRPTSGRAPGADDNASGISTVLEVFRVLAQSGYRPERTLEFMGYAGEEVGLLGSQEISRNYRASDKKVIGAMQFDMTMFPGNGKPITLISDNVDPALTQYVEKLIDTYVRVPWVASACGYGCSDHASWTRAGYASVFPFEAPFEEYNHKIHTPNDVLAILDPEFGSLFAKVGLAYAIEMAGER